MKNKYFGECHCKSIRFEFYCRKDVSIVKCNCSICSITNFLHLIIPHKDFILLKGKEHLHTYQFNQNIAKHFFCKICGIKSFYQPRSHKNCFSINYNSVIKPAPKIKSVNSFNGRDFENNIKALREISTDH